MERANEYLVRFERPVVPVAGVDLGLLTGVLGEPFRTSSIGEQYCRTVGEKAAILVYTLMRAQVFSSNNTLAAAVIFGAFLEKNGYAWNVPREEFLASFEALRTWGPEEWTRSTSWLTELGMMAEWIMERVSPLPDFDPLGGADAP